MAVEVDKIELAWAFHACAADTVESINARAAASIARTLERMGPSTARAATLRATRRTRRSRRTRARPARRQAHLHVSRRACAHTPVPSGYNEKEPPVRDNEHQIGFGQLKYDTTTNDKFKDGVPEIMVTYKDGAAYPEYLVAFLDSAKSRLTSSSGGSQSVVLITRAALKSRTSSNCCGAA